MNKQEFIIGLQERLRGFPQEDIDRSVEYYSEMLDDRMEEGLSEEEAVKALGSLNDIVAQIVSEISLPKLVRAKIKPRRALRAWEIVLLILGSPIWLPILIATAAVVLSAYVVIWSALIVLYAADATLTAVGFAGVFNFFALLPKGDPIVGVIFLGMGFACAGLAIFLFFACIKASKVLLCVAKKLWIGIKFCLLGRRTEK